VGDGMVAVTGHCRNNCWLAAVVVAAACKFIFKCNEGATTTVLERLKENVRARGRVKEYKCGKHVKEQKKLE